MWGLPGSSDGWKRAIKYNVKEYAELVERVSGLRARLGKEIRAVDVERVAWVLGRENADVDADEDENRGIADESGVEENSKDEESAQRIPPRTTTAKKGKAAKDETVSEQPPKKTTKRKTRDTTSPVHAVRKSTRTKK